MTLRYLDEGLLEELRDILDEEFPALLKTYIQDSATRLQDMNDAFARGDADALRKSTHSLKGASANLGLEFLTELCRELEEGALAGPLSGQAARLQQVADERERAVQLLSAYM